MRRCCWHSFAYVTLAITGGLCLAPMAMAQEPSGRAVGVIPDASALRSGGAAPLAVQQPVYMGDRIQTGPSGEAQINFVDSTRLVVGPTSSLLIDSSVMRNRSTMSSFVVSALRGSFRFISGSSPKPAYAIRTPTGTIGVRGTQFDFTVLPNGGTEFVLLHGSARVCDRFGNCLSAQRGCMAISIPPNGPLRAVGNQEERNTRLRTYFPYVLNQYASLRPEFRADVGTCGSLAAIVTPSTRDLVTGSVPASAPNAARPLPAPNVTPAAPSPPRSVTPNSPPSVTPPSGGKRGGAGNGNGNAGNRHGGGNIHGSGPGTGNNGMNNGQGVGSDRGGGGYGSGGGANAGLGGGDGGRGGGARSDAAGPQGEARGGGGGGRGGDHGRGQDGDNGGRDRDHGGGKGDHGGGHGRGGDK